jgi:hypothetical protein
MASKKASHTCRRPDLGQMSRDLSVKRKLLELGVGQMAEAVMPTHELGLVVNGGKVDMLVFLKFRIHIKGEWPHPCCLRFLFSFLL